MQLKLSEKPDRNENVAENSKISDIVVIILVLHLLISRAYILLSIMCSKILFVMS